MLLQNGNMCMCVRYDIMGLYDGNCVCVAQVNTELCLWVAYVLPKRRFISVSANSGKTLDLYVLLLRKVMPNFCMTLMNARITTMTYRCSWLCLMVASAGEADRFLTKNKLSSISALCLVALETQSSFTLVQFYHTIGYEPNVSSKKDRRWY